MSEVTETCLTTSVCGRIFFGLAEIFSRAVLMMDIGYRIRQSKLKPGITSAGGPHHQVRYASWISMDLKL
jgi:hypothetical protein